MSMCDMKSVACRDKFSSMEGFSVFELIVLAFNNCFEQKTSKNPLHATYLPMTT